MNPIAGRRITASPGTVFFKKYQQGLLRRTVLGGQHMQDSMRRVLIDRLLSDKSVVTLQELQDVLKVSIPTIKRDLRYMRKELKAPIVYSRTRGGYLTIFQRASPARAPSSRGSGFPLRSSMSS